MSDGAVVAGSPAERGLTVAIAALAVLGLAVAGYLTHVHYAGVEPVCAVGSCAEVQASEYAELGGVPVAAIGLAGYLAILASLLVPGDAGRGATALLALVGFGYSAYLTYLELGVIDAICQWCVASAILMTAIAAAATARLLRAA